MNDQSTLERARQVPPPPQQQRSDANMTIEEARLINHVRGISYGKIEIEVKKGVPVMIHEYRKDIKLTD